jgi:hypothetical protein
MFRSLGQLFRAQGRTPNDVFLVHPLQLGRWLDEAWATTGVIPVLGTGSATPFPFLGSATIVGDLDLPQPSAATVLPPVPSGLQTSDPDVFNGVVFTVGGAGLVWDHLIYAYLLESTGVFEIMAEVVRRLVVGETLNPLSRDSVRWVRATEELFFREPPLFSISGVVSQLRPDMRVNRRNGYWRLFGLDTPHPIPPRWVTSATGDGAPWKVDVGGGVNTGFREKWNELLRQIWLGIENRANGVGPNATDSEYIAFLATAIKDMLNMRRLGGLLAREEFVHVTTMSWFHLTLESDSPIVQDLRCEGTHPSDRLAKIAQRVGMTAAPRSRELFDLAELMSAFLRAIELGLFDTGAAAENLFIPTTGNAKLREDVNRIIDLWQSATGERVKERPVSVAGRPGSAQPLRLPNPTASPATTDGIVPVAANGRPR